MKSKIIILILLSLGIILIHVNSYYIPNGVLVRHIILIVFIGVATYFAYASRRRHLEKYAKLEKFLRICAWCKTVCITDPVTKVEEWIPFEEYIEREYKFKASHGVCPECCRNQIRLYLSDEPHVKYRG